MFLKNNFRYDKSFLKHMCDLFIQFSNTRDFKQGSFKNIWLTNQFSIVSHAEYRQDRESHKKFARSLQPLPLSGRATKKTFLRLPYSDNTLFVIMNSLQTIYFII